MNPAAAMGTFIRTWRAEWAGLSRAQVAIALNGRPRKGRRISEETVRRWEEGQPPKSTDELEALCAVMGKHGLFPLDLKQFRQAVFAACAGKQFPELLTDEEWIHREDVDARAREVADRQERHDLSVSLVDLVARVDELARAVDTDQRPRPSPVQRQRQRAALVHLRTALARTAGERGLRAHAAQLCRQQAGLLDEHFRGRPLVRDWEADEWRMYHECQMAPTRGARSVQALFGLAMEVERIHDRLHASWVFLMAMSRLPFGTDAQRTYAWQNAREHMGVAEDHGFGPLFCWELTGLGLGMGHVAEAEPLRQGFQEWRNDRDYVCRQRWAARMADWAHVTRDYQAELGYLEQRLAYCRRAGYPEEGLLARIGCCEQACQSANRRKKRSDSASKGKAHQSGRKRRK